MSDINKDEVREVIRFISTDMSKIGIETHPDKNLVNSLGELKKFLTEKISELMDSDYDKLLNALYRIDINEKKLHDLFSGKNREFIPAALADLILERQLQKVIWRKKYRDGKI